MTYPGWADLPKRLREGVSDVQNVRWPAMERAMREAADRIEGLEDRVRILEVAIEAVPANPAIGEWWDQFGDLLAEIHQGVKP